MLGSPILGNYHVELLGALRKPDSTTRALNPGALTESMLRNLQELSNCRTRGICIYIYMVDIILCFRMATRRVAIASAGSES